MTYEYDVALSFAGEEREFAEAVAKGLKDAGIKVFYDSYFSSDLWGKDLSVELREIYHAKSQYCIMILSQDYIDKMWTNYERQQAIERFIQEKHKAYILPVRLDGFIGEVPALSKTINYLPVRRNHPEKVVNEFLKKIGKIQKIDIVPGKEDKVLKTYIPKIIRQFSDKEKNQFLKDSFVKIVSLIDKFAKETAKVYPQIECEIDQISTRKVVFTIYESGKEVNRFKLWISTSIGTDSIGFLQGRRIDIENDNSLNESISLQEEDGELKLKPLGMLIFTGNRDQLMSPNEAAEYLWKEACRFFR